MPITIIIVPDSGMVITSGPPNKGNRGKSVKN